jgi:serine/threonine protein kinase
MSNHPTLDQLATFDLGQLGRREWEDIQRHIAECAVCCGKLETIPDDNLVALMRASARKASTANGPGSTANTLPGIPLPPEIPPELAEHPRYQILEILGAGGMGTVIKAQHRLMNRLVALKVVNRNLVQSPEAVERFHREVQAAARLSHPNIVAGLDAEQAGNVHFLVMEFVPGESLDRILGQGRVDVNQACDWIRQAALGLQHAFEQGMVHRDIKPANLMLTPTSQIKILDFGLARFASQHASAKKRKCVSPLALL